MTFELLCDATIERFLIEGETYGAHGLTHDMYEFGEDLLTQHFNPVSRGGKYMSVSSLKHMYQKQTGKYIRNICLWQVARLLGFKTRAVHHDSPNNPNVSDYFEIYLQAKEVLAWRKQVYPDMYR